MSAWPADVIAIIPVYNHAASVGRVVAELRSHGAVVITVDDGSTDGSGEAANNAGATLLTHATNQGKASALVSALTEAQRRGYCSAVSIDADGQHAVSDALRIAIASHADPGAMHIGVRDMSAAPWLSRIGRWCSNTAVRLCCWRMSGDSQSGLRAYPLPATLQLGAHAVRFAWEVEIVVRAFRAGVRVIDMPVSVSYADRVSHFGALRDTLRCCGVMARLVLSRR